MLKKFSIATLLASVVLFGGVFSSVGAAANDSHQSQEVQTYSKVYYSINGNGKWGNWEELNNYLTTYLNKWSNVEWNKNHSIKNPPKKEEVVEEKPEEPVQQEKPQVEQPAQPEKPVEQPVQPEKTEPAPQEQPQNDGQIESLSQYEQQVVELTNNERTKQGLAPFKADAELSRVAREKSRDMATRNYFDHNSPTYGSPFDMMKAYGISYRAAGENIAKGQRTPEEVVNAWMNSPGHRANILNGDFTHIGVGFVEQGNHWTQMFIGK